MKPSFNYLMVREKCILHNMCLSQSRITHCTCVSVFSPSSALFMSSLVLLSVVALPTDLQVHLLRRDTTVLFVVKQYCYKENVTIC